MYVYVCAYAKRHCAILVLDHKIFAVGLPLVGCVIARDTAEIVLSCCYNYVIILLLYYVLIM